MEIFSAPENIRTKIDLSEDFKKYLINKFQFNENGKPRIIDTDNEVFIENGPYAGLIEFGDQRIEFTPKVDFDLLNVMYFLESEEGFLFDADKLIDQPRGDLFYEIIANIYIKMLSKLIRIGLLKKYVEKKENLKSVRGKILIGENFKINGIDKSKIFCEYDDLTYDNLENRIILYASKILVKKIKHNRRLKYTLIDKINLLEQFVRLTGFDKTKALKINFSKNTKHYRPLISVAQFIIKNEYIGSKANTKTSKGFNFLINLPILYENLITGLIREIILESFFDWEFTPQKRIRALDEQGKLLLKPDIYLKNKITGEIVILDAKYKCSNKNQDYYQVLCYLLSDKNSKSGCLIYPKSDSEKKEVLTFTKDITSNPINYNLPIFSEELILKSVADDSFDSFRHRVNLSIKKMLSSLLLNQGSSIQNL